MISRTERMPLLASQFSLSDVVLLAIGWVVMVALVGPIGDFPQNDDWVYALTVESILKHGRFEALDMTSANLGPQAYWGALFAQLFGFSYTSLRFSTLVLGIACVVALYTLALEIWQDRRVSLILSLAVMVNPVFFALANSFMTDVPFLAMMVLSLLAISTGFRRESTALLMLGLAAAIAAVFIRQFAVVVLAGFALAHIARRGITVRSLVIALLPLCVGLLCHFVFTRWLVESGRKLPPPAQENLLSLSFDTILWTIRYTVFTVQSYLGLFLIPLAIVCFPYVAGNARRRHDRAKLAAIVGTSLLIGCFYLYTGAVAPVGGNILSWNGVGPALIADSTQKRNLTEQAFLPMLLWRVVTVAAIFSSACLIVALAISVRRAAAAVSTKTLRECMPVGFIQGAFFGGVAATYLAMLFLVVVWYTLIDRYVLPLTIVAAFAVPFLIEQDGVLRRPSNGRWVAAQICIAVIASFTVVSTHDHLRWSETRWRALHKLLAQGIPPRKIDGGYEFNGTYLYDPKYKALKPKSWWWVAEDDYLISAGPVDGYREIERLPVDRWWKSTGNDVFVMKRLPTPAITP